MATTAYGSITIVDIGDLGELSITPTSNQPTIVVYDPNGPTYSPNWSTSNLVLTPVVYYGGSALVNADQLSPVTGLTITWYKQGSSTAISTNYQLTINTNVLSSVDYVTYIAKASYTEPQSGVTLQAEGQISFGKVTNASQIKSLEIIGDSTFLTTYDSNNTATTTPSSIVLTANAQYYSGSIYWYYKNGNSWTSTGSAGTTLTITPTHSGFVNGSKTATFRASSASSASNINAAGEIYDIHTIVHVSDGINGSNGTTTKSVVLSNEDEMIPFPSSTAGPTYGNYTDCNTTVSVFDGAEDITQDTNKCRIFLVSRTASQVASASVYTASNTNGYLPVSGTTQSLSISGTNVTGTWDRSTRTCAITSLTADTGRIIFYVYYYDTDSSSWTLITNKKFSLVKVYPGQDGDPAVIYRLNLSSITTTHGSDSATYNIYSPSSITLSAQEVAGSTISAYSDAKYLYSVDGNTEQAITTSTGTLSFGEGQLLPANNITVKLVKSGTTSPVLDTQTITVISDGATGAAGPTGAAGESALSFSIGNLGDQISCTNAGEVAATTTRDIYFKAYLGTTEVACKAYVSSGTMSGLTTNGTGSSNARISPIQVTYTEGSTLGGADQGTLTIVATAYTNNTYATSLGTQTFTYTWVKNKQALDGAPAVVFQLYSSSGDTFVNNEGSITVLTSLLRGGTVETGSSYSWYYWNGSNYVTCNNVTGYTIGTRQLTVAASVVDTYVSLKCVCTYNGVDYTAYYSLYDKSDAFQIQVLSTLGDKLVNSVGTGIVYTKVTKNGQPYDDIVATKCATITTSSSPSSAAINSACNAIASTDSYCWLAIIYNTTKELRLYKRSSSSWSRITTDPHVATYSWTGLHTDGSSATIVSGLTKAKAILINGDIVNKKTTFNVTMTTT